MLRGFVIGVLLLAGTATPLSAEGARAQDRTGARCQETPARQVRRGVFGAIVGRVVNETVGSNSVSRTVASVAPVNTMLTDALMNMLDCREQAQAARATEEVTERAERGGVGTTVAWRSETRPNVTGRSTVTRVEPAPIATASAVPGRRCMRITDIVIIDGEETAVPKRMCRTPPSTRYARADV